MGGAGAVVWVAGRLGAGRLVGWAAVTVYDISSGGLDWEVGSAGLAPGCGWRRDWRPCGAGLGGRLTVYGIACGAFGLGFGRFFTVYGIAYWVA
jgi:hypothetical protein